MADQPALRLPGHPAADGLARAVTLLGWAGTVLPELTLLGCRVVPVVLLDQAAHRARQASGHGPQRDREVLQIWEWPQAAGHVPAPALRVRGMLVRAGTWRRGLAIARTWRGFGPAAVLTGPDVRPGPGVRTGRSAVGDVCRLEFQLSGVGLVILGAAGTGAGAAEPVLGVLPATGRQQPARRRVLDRWIEETLYEHALAQGAYQLVSPPVRAAAASASTVDAVVPTSSHRHR